MLQQRTRRPLRRGRTGVALLAGALLATGCAHLRPAGPPRHVELAEQLSGMIWPLPIARSAEVTSRYGPRDRRHHDGLDIDGVTGDPVHAARDGVVSFSGWMNGYGHTVVLDHGGGVTTLYGHNASLAVRAGQRVRRGERIAAVGASGNARGDHLHFEVAWRGYPIDPRPLLPAI